MKTATAGCLITILFTPVFAAKASEIDLSAWTCKQFQSAAKEEVRLILAWLDGYYRGEDDPPVIDTAQLDANARNSIAIAPPTRTAS